ncbi:MAG: nucleotidyltransferase domain-containing protein, partial [Acidimicrobiales bacterium]
APAFSSGLIGGLPAPCLSSSLQVDLHKGYELRPTDRADLDRLGQSPGVLGA